MRKKILIIDDEPDTRNFLKSLFEDQGYDAVIASDGVSGLKMVNEENPDLITLDIQMPNNTGTDFFRKIQSDKEHKEIPIIIISGVAGRNLVTHRPIPVFDKPIDKEELLKAVQAAIG
jgi:CheY-like chemotaxis protein